MESFRGGRPVGLPKTGGRQKGTPNRASLSVEEKLNTVGCDPIVEMGKLAMNPKFPPEVRAKILYGLAEFIHPKRKPTDAAIAERPEININTNLENSADSVDLRNGCEPKPTHSGESVAGDECPPEPGDQGQASSDI
jgi:hypothetical protein